MLLCQALAKLAGKRGGPGELAAMPHAAEEKETGSFLAIGKDQSLLVGLTPRAVMIGLISVLVTVWLVSYAELVYGDTSQIMIGYMQIPPVAVFLLFFFTGANLLVRRVRPGKELTAPELATIYVMVVPAAMIASQGLLQRVLPVMVAGNYFASRVNDWRDLFFIHTPAWLVPWNPNGPPRQPLVVSFFEGLRRGQALPWQPWVRPVAAWLLLMALVYGAFLCMAAILRKQWVDAERLSFPLVQLPLEMIGAATGKGSDAGSTFFQSRLAWLGFAVPFFVFNLNGLHNIYPPIPMLPLWIDLHGFFTAKPWNSISLFVIAFSFMAIGFFYLLPTEILFSLWFFFALGKVEEVFAASIGYDTPSAPHADVHSFIAAQTMGAWPVLVGAYFILARPHLANVWRAATGAGARDSGEGEMLSYRAAFWGLVGCFAGIVIWCVAAGMSAWLAIVTFGLYLFVQAIVMARSTAEAGLIITEGSWTSTDMVQLAVPYYSLGIANLTVLSYTDAVFTRDLRGMVFTAFLDSERLADGVGLRRRSLLYALVFGMLVAVFAGVILQIWLPYHLGALTLYKFTYQGNDRQFFRENGAAYLAHSVGASYRSGGFVLVGALITVLLSVMRTRLSWWPLQPLGFALSASYTVIVFWFPIFLAWLIKSLVMRYSGMPIYRMLRPFFIGMILGELTAAVEWTLFSMLAHVQAPFFPWP